MTKKELKELIKEVIRESDSTKENDSTKEKAKLVYSILKKREFEYRELTKKSKDPVKKRHFSDMAEKVKNQASDILRSFLDDMDVHVRDWFDD